MSHPVLLVIAHGSRDPRHAATVHALTQRVRAERPGLRVETAFLEFNAPSVPRVLERLAAEGADEVVALPLLLTRAFHAKTDIPSVLREARARLPRLHVRQADVLGPSPCSTPPSGGGCGRPGSAPATSPGPGSSWPRRDPPTRRRSQ